METKRAEKSSTKLLSKRDSLTVSALACHAADPGSNPAMIFSINN